MTTAEIIMEALGDADASLRMAFAEVDCARRIGDERGWTLEPEDRERIAEASEEIRRTAEMLIKHAERLEKMGVRE